MTTIILTAIITFFSTWIIFAITLYLLDNGGNGICLFDGWGTNLMLAPLWVFSFIYSLIYTIIKHFKKRKQKNE